MGDLDLDLYAQVTHHAECWRYHHACAVAEVERLRAGRQRLRSALLQQAAAMARRDTVADAHDLGLISRAAHLRARPTLERADAAAMDLYRAAMRALEDDNG